MANLLNSLFQPQQTQINSQLKQAVQLFKSAQDPNAVLQLIAQKNPQMNQIMQMCSGKNPKDVFIEECNKRGIDPQSIIQQLDIK